jgi:hypothetical protein
MSNINLVITRRPDDIMVHHVDNPAVWDCGKTVSEAIGRWVLTHGKDYGIVIAAPGEENAVLKPEPIELDEDALFAFSGQTTGRPMRPGEREWCLQEIASVEGYERKDYEGCDDRGVARGVLSAWVDFARDKGVIP